MSKLLFFILLACMNVMDIWCIGSGRLTNNERYCVPQPYKPGGGIKTVQEVVAPEATLKTNSFLGVIAKGAKNTGDAGKVAPKVIAEFAKFGKLFKTASKMAPWLGALSGALGFIGKAPSAQDAVDAVNVAFKKFAQEITKRMNEMKGYVDDRIVQTESEWVQRQYRALLNGWADCVVIYHEENQVNECQRRAFLSIRRDRSHFMLFKGKSPNRQELKRLEFQFITIREYSFLTLLVLRSLIDSLKAEKGKLKDYVRMLKLGMVIPQELADYAKFVNNQILNFYDKQTKTICRNTLTCTELNHVYGKTIFGQRKQKAHNRNLECKCKMTPDALAHEWCTYRVDVSVNKNERYDQHWEDEKHMKNKAEKSLFDYSDKYWKQTSSLVRKYWYENVMIQVPKWEEFALNAEKEYQIYKGPNLALRRPTYQSSNYDRWNKEKSSLAVDGNYKQCDWRDHGISMTGWSKGQSWRVILDDVYEMTSVLLYNIIDCCSSNQLSNVNIYVEDVGGKSHLCANTGDMNKVYIKEFKCKAGAIGNVVILRKQAEGSINLCEVVVYGDKVERGQAQNLALNRPTTQSSTLRHHWSGHAVDGQKSTCSLSQNTCSKTDITWNGQTWWEVSLDDSYHIDHVVIYGCGSSLKGMVIFSIKEKEGRDRGRHRGRQRGRQQTVSICKSVFDVNDTLNVHDFKCDRPAFGNILRIKQHYSNSEKKLQLCEVEVYGHKFSSYAAGKENLAYRGDTTQSSNYGNVPSKYDSSHAVNGNKMNCRLPQNTLSITDAEPYHSWWQVRLHSLSKVESVIIYNREDCCSDQLSNADIMVKHITNEFHMYMTEQKFNETGNMENVKAKEFTSEASRFGHIVQIKKQKRDISLALCEVEVYGKKVTKEEMKKTQQEEQCEFMKQRLEKMKKDGQTINQFIQNMVDMTCHGYGGTNPFWTFT